MGAVPGTTVLLGSRERILLVWLHPLCLYACTLAGVLELRRLLPQEGQEEGHRMDLTGEHQTFYWCFHILTEIKGGGQILLLFISGSD